jgi:hypothetical protein
MVLLSGYCDFDLNEKFHKEVHHRETDVTGGSVSFTSA